MTKVIATLCLQYNKEFDERLVTLYHSYAIEDVVARKFNWKLFFEACVESGKHCEFFPAYVNILKEINKIKDLSKYQEMKQLNEAKLSREEVKANLKEIRNRLEKNGVLQ